MRGRCINIVLMLAALAAPEANSADSTAYLDALDRAHELLMNREYKVAIKAFREEDVLRKFVAEREIVWPQVWDEHHEVIHKFKVEAYPTYVLVGPDGEILFRSRGSSSSPTGQLSREVTKALKEIKRSSELVAKN